MKMYLDIKYYWLSLKIFITKIFVNIEKFWDKLNYYALMYMVAPELFEKEINKILNKKK